MPSPTPDAGGGERTEEEIQADVAAFVAAVSAIDDHTARLTPLIADVLDGMAPQESADALRAFGQSNRQLCQSWRYVVSPTEASWADIAVTEKLIERQEVAKSVADAVSRGSEISPALQERTAAAIEPLLELDELTNLVESYDIELEAPGPSRVLVNGALEMEQTVPPEWLVLRDDTQIGLLAPAAAQSKGPGSLGPWGTGAGSTIARVRIASDTSTEGAIELAQNLLNVPGPAVSVHDLSEEGGATQQRLEFELGDGEWSAYLEVLIVGDLAYMVRTACPAPAEECQELHAGIVAGVVLR